MAFATWKKETTYGIGRATDQRCGHTATLYGHKMIVVGGGHPTTPEAFDLEVVVLDLNRRVWSDVHVILGLKYHTTTLVDDKVFCIGGEVELNEGRALRKMEVVEFDLITCKDRVMDTYLAEPKDTPSHTWKHITAFFEAKREIVVHGGHPTLLSDMGSNQLYALDVDEKSWRKLRFHGAPPLSQSSHMCCLNSTGDGMFVFASYDRDPSIAELYNFDYRGSVPTWELIKTQGTIPPGLYGGCCNLIYGRYIVLYAGNLDTEFRDDLCQYDTHTSRWTEGVQKHHEAGDEFQVKGPQPPRISRHSAIVWNGRILYIGGAGMGEELSELRWLQCKRGNSSGLNNTDG